MKVVISSIDPESAQSLASRLVDEGLAACVSVVPGVTSTYRWKGVTETSAEVLLVMKTADGTLPRLMERVAALHPYDVPEILAFETVAAHAPYASWVEASADPDTVD